VKAEQPKLCPDCPLISLLPIIMAKRVCYTHEKEQLTPYKICQLLRALWNKHPYVTLEGCPYFSASENMERYLRAKASAENR